MVKYILKRLLVSLFDIMDNVYVNFFPYAFNSRQPVFGDGKITSEILANLEAKYGLDKP